MALHKLFYIYLHTKQTNGTLFYVGKGYGRRWRHFTGRNIYWQRTVQKNGCQPHILFAGLPEAIAFELETFVIQHFRNEGVNLVNLTNGGEGNSGGVRERKAIVCIETGRQFACNQEAAKWVGTFGIKAVAKTIQSSLLKKKRAYGLTWVYPEKGRIYLATDALAQPIRTEKIAKVDMELKLKPLPRPIVCIETGFVYASIRDALDWIKITIPFAKLGNLSANIDKNAKAYGLTWQVARPDCVYIPTNPSATPFHKAEHSVVCVSTGALFMNTTAAAEWVSEVRGKRSSRRKISDNCTGKTQSAFGFIWRYA